MVRNISLQLNPIFPLEFCITQFCLVRLEDSQKPRLVEEITIRIKSKFYDRICSVSERKPLVICTIQFSYVCVNKKHRIN